MSKYSRAKRAYDRDRYAMLRDAHLCVLCKGDPLPGLVHCAPCLEYKYAHQRRTPEQVARQRQKATTWARIKRKQRKLDGKCIDCGGEKLPNLVRCQRCREIQAGRQKKGSNRRCGHCGEAGHYITTCAQVQIDQRAKDAAYRQAQLLEIASGRNAA